MRRWGRPSLAVLLTLLGANLLRAENPRKLGNVAADLALSEGLYTDEFLRDPAAAAEWFRAVLADPGSAPAQRHQARFRLARCLRRLNHPDEARKLLTDLIEQPSAPEELRARAQAELAAMPRVEPARLMPADTLIYLELSDPGPLLDELVALIRNADLGGAARVGLTRVLQRYGAQPLIGFLNENMQAELGKVEGAGVAWYNFRVQQRAGEPVFGSDLLFVLYTGESVATAGFIQGLIAQAAFTGLLATYGRPIENIQFYAAPVPNPDLRFAISDGLFVACTDIQMGTDAILRYRGQRRGPTLAARPVFKSGPAAARRDGALSLFVDWPRLIDLFVAGAGPGRREELDIVADVLSLRQVGPVFGALRLENDELDVVLSAEIDSTQGLIYRLLYSPPLESRWRRFVPADVAFGFATGVNPGDRRWRDLERFLVESARLGQWSGSGATSAPTTAPWPDPLAFIRRFERGALLSVPEDVCRDVRGGALALLNSGDPASEPAGGRWVLSVEIEQADLWLRRLEFGLRRLLFGGATDAPLPKTTLDTAVGPVDLLTLPGTSIGVAWQQTGDRVTIAFGADTLIDYLGRTREDIPGDRRPSLSRPESKFLTLRLRRTLAWLLNRPVPALPEAAAPLTIRTFEQDRQVRIEIQQRTFAAVLKSVAELLQPPSAAPPDQTQQVE